MKNLELALQTYLLNDNYVSVSIATLFHLSYVQIFYLIWNADALYFIQTETDRKKKWETAIVFVCVCVCVCGCVCLCGCGCVSEWIRWYAHGEPAGGIFTIFV
jgi:hypothetical protein